MIKNPGHFESSFICYFMILLLSKYLIKLKYVAIQFQQPVVIYALCAYITKRCIFKMKHGNLDEPFLVREKHFLPFFLKASGSIIESISFGSIAASLHKQDI